jgi:hypothetical protein
MIRLSHATATASAAAAPPAQPVPLLDARVVALLRDGRLRTAAQVADTLRTAPDAVQASLLRLAERRRVLRAGYVVPRGGGYGTPWPTLWGLIPKAA